MTRMQQAETVTTDARGRAALGRKGQTFRMTTLEDGSILLAPARVYTDAEVALLRDATLRDTVAASHAEMADGRRTPRTRDRGTRTA